MSSIIGYNKENIAISDKSLTAGKEIIIPIYRDGTVLNWKEKHQTLDKEYNFLDKINLTYLGKRAYFNSPTFKGDRPLFMFSTDFKNMLFQTTIYKGSVMGRFGFVCRGGYIGLQYLGET